MKNHDSNQISSTIKSNSLSRDVSHDRRDFRPSNQISQESVNDIPFIDCSLKTILTALLVFVLFGLAVSNQL